MSTYRAYGSILGQKCAACGVELKLKELYWIDKAQNDPDLPLSAVRFYHSPIDPHFPNCKPKD